VDPPPSTAAAAGVEAAAPVAFGRNVKGNGNGSDDAGAIAAPTRARGRARRAMATVAGRPGIGRRRCRPKAVDLCMV